MSRLIAGRLKGSISSMWSAISPILIDRGSGWTMSRKGPVMRNVAMKVFAMSSSAAMRGLM
jgi:hypothetical protein